MKRSQNKAGQTPKLTSGGPCTLTAQQYLGKYSVTAYLKVRKCIESTRVGPESCYLLATRLHPPPTPTRAAEHTTLASYPSPPAPTPWRPWRRASVKLRLRFDCLLWNCSVKSYFCVAMSVQACAWHDRVA